MTAYDEATAKRFEKDLMDAEDALFKAIMDAPTEGERQALLAEYHTILMIRYSNFPATWGDEPDEDAFAEGGDADGD